MKKRYRYSPEAQARNDAYRKEYYQKHKIRLRALTEESRLQKQYGITSTDAAQMYKEQEGRCALCRREAPDSGRTGLHIDHNHTTQKVRALLCGSCNRGLGMFGESIETLQRAITYLQQHGS